MADTRKGECSGNEERARSEASAEDRSLASRARSIPQNYQYFFNVKGLPLYLVYLFLVSSEFVSLFRKKEKNLLVCNTYKRL